MAITTLTGLTPEWFETEKGDEPGKSGFYIRPLNGWQYQECLQFITTGGQIKPDGVKLCVKYGLENWRNIKDASGAEIEFSVKKALEIIPAKYLLEIAGRVFEVSTFDGEPTKN